MRMLFIRHGDPDYVHDTLTEKGRREAALLAEYAPKLNVGECYVSPLGRAQDTASYSLKKLGKTAQTLGWLREFPAVVNLNETPHLLEAYPTADMVDGKYKERIVWDVMPSYLMEHGECLDPVRWRESDICRHTNTVELYDQTIEKFDQFLAEHGYVRDGIAYRVEKESTVTTTFFCHFGITCVFLSRLWNVSPFAVWQSVALAPTSVTEVVTEERQQGIAYFRGLRIGDISHLSAGNEPASFSARFCETYSNMEQRH
ncbi:MAG TPA: histidine phosphatase family protein [Candidatus Mediterraneibacter vanvlietii]|nr:histidine phosphatase family protein [Candidatus Mediterraneibacter vanvlietii]